jgi:hypothetical protein
MIVPDFLRAAQLYWTIENFLTMRRPISDPPARKKAKSKSR